MSTMSFDRLRDAVGGDAVAVRVSARLQPAGGRRTPVYPPTYAVDGRPRTRYAVEGPEPLEGEDVRNASRWQRVVLDSVASQANRLELALLAAWERGDLAFPVAFVDFGEHDDLADLDRVTALEAPHRIADAIFRDSLLDGTLFRLSDVGRAVTEARPDNAAGLYRYCPTALLFGQWDSTGPKGGAGSKFQRAIVSEIVGHDVTLGATVGSRIDPLQIGRGAAHVYQAEDPDEEWTLIADDPDVNEALPTARMEKGEPVLFDRKGRQGEKGRPAMINHGNVTPGIDMQAGGVVVDHATQTLVLSLAALRKLRFPEDAEGQQVPRDRRDAVETAARTVVAALGVAAVSYQTAFDYDLRSRCLLVPEEAPVLELVGRNGGVPERFDLDIDAASELVATATRAAGEHGMAWGEGPVRLTPAPKLVELIRRSRAVATTEGVEG